MKIAVCDDEHIFCERLITAIEEYFGRLEVTCTAYGEGYMLLKDYEQGKRYDALFLDIEMPGLDGMKTAEQIRKKGYGEPIVFLTSHTEMAMEGYEVDAFRFLAKPVREDKLQQALQDIKELLFEKKRFIICCEGEEVVLRLEDIRYIEAMNNCVCIFTVDGEYTIRRKISDLEKELLEIADIFVRVHRGYLVNLIHVKRHRGNEIYVTGDKVLPLSRGMAKSFKEQLLMYVRSSAR